MTNSTLNPFVEARARNLDLVQYREGEGIVPVGPNSRTGYLLNHAFLSDFSRFIELTNFTISVGTPALTVQGANLRYAAWAFDGTNVEAVTTQTFRVPNDYSSGAQIFLNWTNLSGTAGNVVWRLVWKVANDTADLNSTTSENSIDNTIAAPAQDILKISQLTSSMTLAAGDHVKLNVARMATDAADTVNGADVGMLKLQFTYTAVL